LLTSTKIVLGFLEIDGAILADHCLVEENKWLQSQREVTFLY